MKRLITATLVILSFSISYASDANIVTMGSSTIICPDTVLIAALKEKTAKLPRATTIETHVTDGGSLRIDTKLPGEIWQNLATIQPSAQCAVLSNP